MIPLVWCWHNLPNITAGWMAASYVSTFLAYLFVSFFELCAWITYLFGFNLWLRVWVEFSFYSFIWMVPAWLFAFVEMTAPVD